MRENNVYTHHPEITDIGKIDFPDEYVPERPLTEEEQKELNAKLEKKVKANRRSIFKIISHLKALKNYMMDKDVKWVRKSIVVAAVLYFITPIDAVPDLAPLIGYLDDFGVIAWTVRFLGKEINDYYD